MAEEEDQGAQYQLVDENGNTKPSSRDHTGKGTAKYPNGDVYEGDFSEGRRDGRGIYRYGNGDKFEGQWKENFKHGIGKMVYNGRGTYQGYWENGRRHGEGVFTYPNGDVYSGWWRYGEKEGTGTYLSKKTNMKLFGEWSNGEFTTGRWVYPNGVYYEGAFQNNKPVGKGVWNFKNGNKLDGEFTQKVREPGEDEEPVEAEDGAPVKQQFDIAWQCNTNIAAAAHKVNSVEQ